MAATETGVWDLQDVRDKQLESEWSYDANDPHTLYAWGRDSQGELGLNYKAPGSGGSRSSPTQVGTNSNWNTVADGKESNFTIGTKTDGTLWSWGYGNQGELGQGSTSDGRSSPIQIPGTTWSKNISTGENFAMATKTDGTLWGWGKNPDGSLGQNNQTKYSSPIQVGTDTTWKYVACVNKSSLATKTDGTLWAWGDNGQGQMGHNSKTKYTSPKQVGADTNWTAVSSQWYSSFGVKTDGTLWSWGSNGSAQLGHNNGTDYSSPMQLPGTFPTGGTGYTASGGRYHAAILNSAGELYTMGSNNEGQLGHNNRTNYSSPRQVPGSWKYLITSDEATAAIKTDGTMWAWGHNEYGEVGNNKSGPSNNGISSPTQVGTLDGFATMGSAQHSFFGLREA